MVDSHQIHSFKMENQRVYQTYRRFPELYKTRTEGAQLEDANRKQLHTAEKQKAATQSSGKKANKQSLEYSRKNSEKIFKETKKLSNLTKTSVYDDLRTMNNFTRTMHENRMSQRKVGIEQNLSYLYTKQDPHAYYTNNTLNGRPNTAPVRNMHPSYSDLDLKRMSSTSPQNTSRVSSPQTTGRRSPSRSPTQRTLEKSSPPASPKPLTPSQERTQQAALRSICDKLMRVGFSLSPHASDSENILDCGLLTVLSSGASTNRLFYNQPEYVSKTELQNRMIVVLGIKLATSELEVLYTLLMSA